jgi:tetrahydromethanopterin S-methyltransferase subunit G
MTDQAQDQEQNRRIRDLEARVNTMESQLAAIVAKLDTLTTIARTIGIIAGAALGIDVLPMLGGV